MSWSSRKYPLDKIEFIAPMDAYPFEKKASLYLSLKYYLKALHSKFKHFEILS